MFKNFSPSALGAAGHQSEMIELALTFGFGGLDLNGAEFATRAELRGMPYARRLIDSAKIQVGTFPLPLEWDVDDDRFAKDLKKLPAIAAAAAEVGCTRCVATVAPAGDNRPYHENFEFHRLRFDAICKALEPAGVRLGVGFQAGEFRRKDQAFQFIHDFDALTLLLNMVEASNIGLVLDPWDMVVGGGSIDAIKGLPVEQIVAVEVAELPGEIPLADVDDKSRLLPSIDQARIDIVSALTMLSELGYEGPVTLKPSRSLFQGQRRDAVARKAGEALDRVWRAAGITGGGKTLAMAPVAQAVPDTKPEDAEAKPEDAAKAEVVAKS